MLDAHVALTVGELAVDVHLDAAPGEVVALLGPNGAGKSTIVAALAGLRAVESGRITLDGTVLDDPATDVFVPPAERPVGVVFQDYLLFPRLDALDNVAFGLRARGASRRAARAHARTWLERFGLAAHAHARPATLSGGQAQRVALARALATEPRLLLLDEPLAALDASARAHVRSELRSQLAAVGGARVLVTHDPVDALVLADRLVVVEAGRVSQTGTAREIAARPASRYVADLVGINLLDGRRAGAHTVRLATGAELVVADALPEGDTRADATLAGTEERPGTVGTSGAGGLAVALRPQAVALYREAPHGSPRNTWRATIAGLEADHDRVRVALTGPVPVTAEVTVGAAEALGLAPGDEVWASVKAVDLTVYER